MIELIRQLQTLDRTALAVVAAEAEKLDWERERFHVPMVMVGHDLADVDTFARSLVAFGTGRVLEALDYQARRAAGECAEQIFTLLFEAASSTNVAG